MPEKQRCAVIITPPQEPQYHDWEEALRSRGIDANYVAWELIRCSGDWKLVRAEHLELVLAAAASLKKQYPDCELTLVFAPMHGVTPTGDFTFIHPKNPKKKPYPYYDVSEVHSTKDLIETVAKARCFDQLCLFFCHGQLAVNGIPELQAEADPHAMKVIAFESWIWTGDKTGSKAEVFLAKGLPLGKGGQFAPKSDTWVTDVHCLLEGEIFKSGGHRIGRLRKKAEPVEKAEPQSSKKRRNLGT